MNDNEILAGLDFAPSLCKWCLLPAVVEFSWDKPCGHPSRQLVCDGHVPLFLEKAQVPQSWACVCGEWAVYRLDGCLQVVAVAR